MLFHGHAELRMSSRSDSPYAQYGSGQQLRTAARGQRGSGEARRAFGDVLAMYDLRSVDGRQIIDVAADLLAAGIDGPAVVELASIPVTPLTSPFEVDARVASAREELRMPPLSPDALATRAAQGQLRRWRQGLLTDRDIASCAHGATVTADRRNCKIWSS